MKSHLKKLMILGIFLAFAGFGCNSNSPEAVIKSMKKNMAKLNSVSFDVEYSGESGQLGQQSLASGITAGTVMVTASGSVEFGDQGINSAANFNVVTESASPVTLVGEYKAVDGDRFARLSSFELGGETEETLTVDTSLLLEKWIKISSAVDEGEHKEFSKKDAYNLFINTKFLAGIEDLGGDDQNFKYKVSFDKDVFISFLEELAVIRGEVFTGEDRVAALQLGNKLEVGELLLWISRDDRMLTRFEVNSSEDSGDANMKIEISAKVSLSEYNQGGEIKAPEGWTDITTLTSPPEEIQTAPALDGSNPALDLDPRTVIDPSSLQLDFDIDSFTQEDFDEYQKLFQGVDPGPLPN